MPNSYDDFIYQLERNNLKINDIAFALHSLQHCEWCDVELIDYENLQWAVSHFYKENDVDGAVASILINGGFNIPDFDFPRMCPHCAHLYDLGE